MKKILSIFFLLLTSQIKAQISFVTSAGGPIHDPPNIETFPIVFVLPNTTIDSTFGLVSVCFNIVHTYDGDLDIRLQSPDGTVIELSNNNGGGGDNYTGTCVREDAGNGEISVNSAPFSG